MRAVAFSLMTVWLGRVSVDPYVRHHFKHFQELCGLEIAFTTDLAGLRTRFFSAILPDWSYK